MEGGEERGGAKYEEPRECPSVGFSGFVFVSMSAKPGATMLPSHEISLQT